MGVYKLSGAGGLLTPRVNHVSMLAGNEAFLDGGDYELISSSFLSSAAPSVTFDSLGDYSATFRHLQIRYAIRSDRAAASDDLYVRVNGETASSNYRDWWIKGNGSTSNTNADFALAQGFYVSTFPAATEPENRFGAGFTDVMEAFSSTKQKSFLSLAGYAGTTREVYLSGNVFTPTTPISSITLRTNLGNFTSGSRFSLYGFRG